MRQGSSGQKAGGEKGRRQAQSESRDAVDSLAQNEWKGASKIVVLMREVGTGGQVDMAGSGS